MFIIVAFGNFFHIFKKILLKFAEVAPVGAWIEIMLVTGARKAVMEVAPVGAWIEMPDCVVYGVFPGGSRPCWGVD